MSKLGNIVLRLQHELMKEYGPRAENGLLKIGVTPELYDDMLIDSLGDRPFKPSCGLLNLEFCGVEIVPTKKSDF